MKTTTGVGIYFLFLLLFPFSIDTFSQDNKEKTPVSFRDSLDNCLDLSDVIIEKKGFVPMPVIVTEPALGGFGGGLAPIFIERNPPVMKDGKPHIVPPNITAIAGGYTLNDSWMIGGGRAATIRKWGLRYAIGGAYANVNMDYYFNLGKLGKDVKMGFNIQTIPVFLSVSKQLRNPEFAIGLQYLFMHNKVELVDNNGSSEEIIDVFKQKFGDYVSNKVSGNVAKLGTKIGFDNRNTVFTPDRGLRTYLTAEWSNPLVGSEYKYGQFEGAVYYYFPIMKTLITGTRFDVQQIVGNQPFYMRPFIDMRGVPTARYIGKSTMLAEVEERWDFVNRWSLVLFGGGGKAFDKYSEFDDAEWAWGYGTGFRYLMARKLNLRMGVDFAMGTEGFAYYLVFGTAWMRQ